jgi:hypothetical protein
MTQPRTSAAKRSHSAAASSLALATSSANAADAQLSSSMKLPVMARPTSCAIAGKQTAVLKTSVTDEVKDEFARWWRSKGYQSESDCLRELVLVSIYGPSFLTDLHAARINSLVQNPAVMGAA